MFVMFLQSEESLEALRPERYLPVTTYRRVVKLGTRCYIKEMFKTFGELKPPMTPAEWDWFRSHPQFKHLFHMPRDNNHKVQGMWMLVLRTADITKRKELWFVVNGVPVRYGLREHALISGLDCRNYPGGERGNMEFVTRHFSGQTVRYEDVKAKLKKMRATDDRLKMLVLFFLSSVICAHKKTGSDAPDVLDEFKTVVDDLEFCKTYPWGRLSYEFMVEAVRHTAQHFKDVGDVREDTQWAIPGFCLPLEQLAFEAIPDLARRFRETVPGADSMCPRMCKSKFKRNKKKGFPLKEINEALGTTQDIDSRILITSTEERRLLRRIYEEDDDRDEDDPVVESWYKRLEKKYTVFFEDMFDEDVAARDEKDETADAPVAPVAPAARQAIEVPPSNELAELRAIVTALKATVEKLEARVTALEGLDASE